MNVRLDLARFGWLENDGHMEFSMGNIKFEIPKALGNSRSSKIPFNDVYTNI